MSKATTGIRRHRTPFEWSILAVSIAAIATIAGGLVLFSVSSNSSPPDLRASLRVDGDHLVLRVDNRGGTTAEDVIVEISRGPSVVEVTFRSIAKGDFEEATVSIRGPGAPTAHVTSYKEP